MKKVRFFYLFLIVLLVASCNKDELTDPMNFSDSDALKSAVPKFKIAVVSDIHYMSPELLPANPETDLDYQMNLAQDPKLITQSDAILTEVVADLIKEKPNILLIPGDLTKDGEKMNHEDLAKILKKLTDSGIKVFVIPGNHDINNPNSYSFAEKKQISSITADEFESIYYNFGYKNSVRDENSLSYINKVTGKLWILGIDACKYEQNTTEPIVSGAIKPETMSWIQKNMEEANSKGIQVLAMMHHGILQHYYGQEQLDPGYLVENWPDMAAAFMGMGIKVVFTGHYHANDIAQISNGNYSLSDIETGSLVSWPSPYRIIKIDGDALLNIDSRQVTTIEEPLPGGMDFVSYSRLFHEMHFDGYFSYALNIKYGIDELKAIEMAPYFRNAIMAHYAGDENPYDSPEDLSYILSNIDTYPILNGALSLWNDLPIQDNQAQIAIK